MNAENGFFRISKNASSAINCYGRFTFMRANVSERLLYFTRINNMCLLKACLRRMFIFMKNKLSYVREVNFSALPENFRWNSWNRFQSYYDFYEKKRKNVTLTDEVPHTYNNMIQICQKLDHSVLNRLEVLNLLFNQIAIILPSTSLSQFLFWYAA